MAKQMILVVDDDDLLAELVGQHLMQAGYTVKYAFNGVEAVEKAKSIVPDLIVLDCVMPEMSGFDVLIEIKQFPHTEKIPVLMLTARGLEADMESGLALGADYYMLKPFNPVDLVNRVSLLLQKARVGTNN